MECSVAVAMSSSSVLRRKRSVFYVFVSFVLVVVSASKHAYGCDGAVYSLTLIKLTLIKSVRATSKVAAARSYKVDESIVSRWRQKMSV